jgi:hypothetical protein
MAFAFQRSTCKRSISSISKTIAFPVARISSFASFERPSPQLRNCSILSSSRRPLRNLSPSRSSNDHTFRLLGLRPTRPISESALVEAERLEARG